MQQASKMYSDGMLAEVIEYFQERLNHDLEKH